MPLSRLSPFFRYWRTSHVVDREVVDAIVTPDHAGPSEQLERELQAWPGRHYWAPEDGAGRLVLIRSIKPPPRERWWLHITLFLVTFFTVWRAGATLIGPLYFPRVDFAELRSLSGLWLWLTDSMEGLGFAGALMAILLIHELGHYVYARRYLINASPPYFLPAPPVAFLIGTFGAFIRLRSPIVDRRQLFDVGAAGPWAGFIVSIVVLALGLTQSQVVTGVHGESGQLIYLGNGRSPFFLGDSILMDLMRGWLVGEGTVVLHPLALAGWFGVFVTMLNLMPLGQLDGGHIVYALVGRYQTLVGLVMWGALVVLGTDFKGWWIWAFLILLLGRGRIAHPSVLEPHRPVPRSRWPLGIATILLFLATFSANPLPGL